MAKISKAVATQTISTTPKTKIDYEDKVNVNNQASYQVNQLWTAEDANQVKEVVNNISDNTNFYCFAGEIKIYETEAKWNESIKNRLCRLDGSALEEGVDFSYFEGGRTFMTGFDGSIGGSYKITNENLPFKEFWFTLMQRPGDWGWTPELEGLSLQNVVRTFNKINDSNTDLTRIISMGNRSAFYYQVRYTFSIGSNNQTDFQQPYQKMWAVKFLNDIYRKNV